MTAELIAVGALGVEVRLEIDVPAMVPGRRKTCGERSKRAIDRQLRRRPLLG